MSDRRSTSPSTVRSVATIVLVGLLVVFASGCGGSDSATRAPQTTAPPIGLSPDATVELPSAPDPSSTEGIVIAGAYALAGDGVVFVGTVTNVTTERGEFDLDYAVTTLRVDRPLLGRPGQEVKIRSADAFFAMETGASQLIFAGPDEKRPDMYNPIETYVLDDIGGRWATRTLTKDELQSVLAEEDIVELLDQSREFLEERQVASGAVLVVEPAGDGMLTVSGFEDGTSLGLQVCSPNEGFRPATDADQCDAGTLQVITPDQSRIEVAYRPPSQIETTEHGTVDCGKAVCAFVVYDLGWPNEVFTIYGA